MGERHEGTRMGALPRWGKCWGGGILAKEGRKM